jgi:glycerol-3-phosphate O-acyltransferase
VRGHGYRHKESRLAALLYTVQEAPGEMKRLLSLIWNAHDASITVGKHVDLREFAGRYRNEGRTHRATPFARAADLPTPRGACRPRTTLLPKRVVREIVLTRPEVREAVAQTAHESGKPEERVRRTAERYFHEMLPVSTASDSWCPFNRLWARMFKGLETRGLEKVIACVKLHPVVLVPCHRSHFDYLILSYIFHINHLSPPHIAAGINLSFWPLGPLFRRRSVLHPPLVRRRRNL